MAIDTALERHYVNLTYWAARQCVIGIGSPAGWLYLCQVSFHRKDGSIFVQFPHFRDRDGIVCSRLAAGGRSPSSRNARGAGSFTEGAERTCSGADLS